MLLDCWPAGSLGPFPQWQRDWPEAMASTRSSALPPRTQKASGAKLVSMLTPWRVASHVAIEETDPEFLQTQSSNTSPPPAAEAANANASGGGSELIYRLVQLWKHYFRLYSEWLWEHCFVWLHSKLSREQHIMLRCLASS